MENLNGWINLKPFQAWCMKILPTVFDESMSYYECLCKMVEILNNTLNDVNLLNEAYLSFISQQQNNYDNFTKGQLQNYQNFTTLLQNDFNTLKNFVDNYFENLDVQNEINEKLDEMVTDGTFSKILYPYFSQSPIFVDSVSDMTNKNAVYVLKSNAHIYFYEGSWKDTGIIYGGLDSMSPGNIFINNTDIPSFGTDLNNFPLNKFLAFTGASSTVYQNLPYTPVVGSYIGYTSYQNRSGAQILINYDGRISVRNFHGNKWEEWVTFNNNELLKANNITYTNSNISNIISDNNINTLQHGFGYYLSNVSDIENLPDSPFTGSIIDILSNYSNNIGCQIAIDKSNLYYRNYINLNYSEWNKIIPSSLINYFYQSTKQIFNNETADKIVPSLNINDVKHNMGYALSTLSSVANTPISPISGSMLDFSTWINTAGIQIILTYNGILYMRNYHGSVIENWSEFIPANHGNLLGAIKNINAIGDSLTAGYFEYDTAKLLSAQAVEQKRNWISNIGDKNGWNVVNNAVGGTSSLNWRNTLIANINNSDCFIYCVGTNDLRNSLELGSEEDVTENYEDAPTTSYGNTYFNLSYLSNKYGKKIFVISLLYKEKGTENYNIMLKYVCSKVPNAIYIDITDTNEYKIANTLTSNRHFTEMGYMYIGNAIERKLNEVLINNASKWLGFPFI